MPPPDFAALEIGTSERPVVASPQYQHLLAIHTPFHFMPDLLSEFGEDDMTNAIGLPGQPPLLPSPTVYRVGAARPPPQPVVTSPRQVSAANRRRTNPSPGRFVCGLCPRDFTAKHNLQNHINSHLKKKDHKCGSCGKSFATRSSLNRHSKKCRVGVEQILGLRLHKNIRTLGL
ncbi:hypothetical protein K443DRAFT_103299 [Laccaria amethystina LaAM-08-1]|uniref:C2H2-type domain-containing protein n=1 Tax=Laccaria amethystina LaAM-08-1 TaxID=1095629 RepID=A0A0C9XMT1_9AGAR|nr:hypothetical protein K443DRAFT_103299 [Laccaria amethystina LaAM-08-1]